MKRGLSFWQILGIALLLLGVVLYALEKTVLDLPWEKKPDPNPAPAPAVVPLGAPATLPSTRP